MIPYLLESALSEAARNGDEKTFNDFMDRVKDLKIENVIGWNVMLDSAAEGGSKEIFNVCLGNRDVHKQEMTVSSQVNITQWAAESGNANAIIDPDSKHQEAFIESATATPNPTFATLPKEVQSIIVQHLANPNSKGGRTN